LTESQREAARMEFTGSSGREIAATLSVSPETISRWRAIPEYQAALSALNDEADRQAIRSAARVREKALRLTERALERGSDALDGEESASGIAVLGRMGLDTYRATSAQTGLAETTRHAIDVSTAWRDAAADVQMTDRRALAETAFSDADEE
jgi:hypothetical protein